MRHVLLATFALAGCYSPSLDPCRISCAEDVACPGELECGADFRCHAPGDTTACNDGDGGVDSAVPAGEFKALAVGDELACAIGADDEVYCWGNAFVGQLGDGTYLERPTPAAIDEPGPWKAIGAGDYHACAIKVSGELFCWGSNDLGEVDGSATGPEPTPRQVSHPDGAGFSAVAAGASHTCAIDDTGAMVCWGAGDGGQLGTGSGAGVHEPEVIAGHSGWASVSASDNITCARKDDDRGFCWGVGPIGQSGGVTSSPAPVEIDGDHRFRSLSANRTQGCGVTTAGALLCWGDNQLGELGDSDGQTPSPAQTPTDFVDVFAGRWVTCASRSSTTELTCFGDNRDGQLGRGDRTTLGDSMLDLPARVIAADTGNFFTCVLDLDGTIWCFGRDDHGQCGDGVTDDRFLDPLAPIAALGGETIVELSGRFWHTCARSDGGRLWCWGNNEGGQIGDGDTVDRAIPVEVPQQGGPWIAVTTGAAHTCAIADLAPFDLAYCWGSDFQGQAGNGSLPGARTPNATVATGVDLVAIGGGYGHICAIDDSDERWCWGDNAAGELGGGALGAARNSPLLIDNGPAGWRRIDGGLSYSCGLSSGGQLWCWGSNQNGRLGVGATPTMTDVPLQVGVASNWRHLATDAQSGSTCGIRDDAADGGDLYCWGVNDNYQLGTADQTGHDTPLQVGTAVQWLGVDLGAQFACGLDAASNLRCWGANQSLQIAPGPSRDHVSGVPTTTIWPGVTVDILAAGYDHVCAVAAGQVYCWGDGSYGQLGDGNRATRVPRPVITPP